MRPIEQLEQHFLNNGVKESQLLMCGKYISLYVKELCSVYDIEHTEDALNKTCKSLCYTMLKTLINISNSTDITLSSQINGMLNDFQTDSKKGIGNLIPLLDIANRNEETNTQIISELADIFVPDDTEIFNNLN